MNNSPQEILDKIKNSKQILICMDSRFDFDALCSVISMKYVLSKLKLNCDVIFEGNISDQAKKLVDIGTLQENTHPNTKDLTKYDTLITLDTGSINHLTRDSDFIPPKNLAIIKIDHHASGENFGHFNFVDPQEAATCTVLLKLFNEWHIEIDTFLANNLLLGLLTDTGFLQFQNAKAKELRIAADLVDKGADMFKLIWTLTFSDDLNKMRTRALIYNHTKIDPSGEFAYSYIEQKDLKQLNIDNATLDSINPSDLIKRLSGVKFVFVVKESETQNSFNVSLRSHDPNFEVSAIAEKLGGGGHKVAAGVHIKVESVQKAIDKIAETAKDMGLIK